jgi:hypothetical protein
MHGKLGSMEPPWLGNQGPSAGRFLAAIPGVSPITRAHLLWQPHASPRERAAFLEAERTTAGCRQTLPM